MTEEVTEEMIEEMIEEMKIGEKIEQEVAEDFMTDQEMMIDNKEITEITEMEAKDNSHQPNSEVVRKKID